MGEVAPKLVESVEALEEKARQRETGHHPAPSASPREAPLNVTARQAIASAKSLLTEVRKHALREAVRPLVTDRAYRSPKRLFLAPPVFGDAPGPLAQLAQDTVRSAALDSVPFLDAAKVRRLFDLLPSREERVRIAHDPVVCTAVSACLLQRRFGL